MHATLTFRQERFVFEYLKDQNASAAAARAGYTASNLASAGSELMKSPAIRDRVRLEMQNLLAEAQCSVMDLLKERMRAAHFRVDKVIAPSWKLRPLEEIDEETRQALEVSTVLRRGVPEVRLRQPDRHQALRALERVHEKLERLEQQEYRRLEKAGELPTLEAIEAAEAAAVAEEAQRLAAESSEKGQELSGCHAVVPADGAGAESIFAKNDSCLLSPGAMSVAPRLQTVKKDQGLSGSAARPAEATRARFAEIPKVLSGSNWAARRVPPAPHPRDAVAQAVAEAFLSGAPGRARQRAAPAWLAAA